MSNIDKVDVEKKSTHILVIRLSAMGDIAMTVPVIRTFRATYPDVKITILTRKFFEPIFSDIEHVNVFHADVDGAHKGFLGLIRLANALKKLEITAVADMHNVLRSNVLKTVFSLSGIKVVQINKGRKEKKSLTRPENKVFRSLKTTHQRYADVFSGLGYPLDLSKHEFPVKKSLTQGVLTLTQNSVKKWLGIAPFAQYDSKTYPLELIIEVIETIDATNTVEIFLFGGGKKEEDILHMVSSKYQNVTNIAGKLPFADELTLISNLDGMLSMDSGNGHLAAMYGIPTITLWGVTHPFTGFAPFNQPLENAILPDLERYSQIPTSIYGNKVPSGYEKVMYTIAPKHVVSQIKKLLNI
ncbi:glycosyltransferase family 9 protein [Aquimarina pacifica]|uniref:glycosyltransferase family 9 protein n=1 Tax=Aquimarina pacifica TaxID=1296415 RepID=UPI0004722F27|nr:glycosyltransferase family 9 protein [Aquimarina pacifica]